MNRAEITDHIKTLITKDRNKIHGDPQKQLPLATKLKEVLHHGNFYALNDTEKEALDMIISKISRLVTGKSDIDHWIDIAGFAIIGAESCQVNIDVSSSLLNSTSSVKESYNGAQQRARASTTVDEILF